MEKRILVLVNNVDSYILKPDSTVKEMINFIKGVDKNDMSSLEKDYFRIIDIERGEEIGCFMLEEFNEGPSIAYQIYDSFPLSLDNTLEGLFDKMNTTTIASI